MLNLADNALGIRSTFPNFSSAKCLKSLILDQNDLKWIPPIGRVTSLEMLSLAKNSIEDISFPREYRYLTHLTRLNLNGNFISKFDISEWENVHVENINEFCYKGRSKSIVITTGFFNYFKNITKVCLRVPRLANTSLSDVINSLSNATNLKELRIVGTGRTFSITHLFSPLNKTGLQALHVSHFDASIIRKDMFTFLPHLSTLTLANVPKAMIRKFEDQALSELLNLKTLDLTGVLAPNISLNTSIFPPNLESLSLQGNTLFLLGNLPPSLKQINMYMTTISGIHLAIFKGLIRLEYLDVTRTLKTINISRLLFEDMRNLKKLMLCNNGIQTLHQGVFDDLKLLQYIDLSDNILKHFEDIDSNIFQIAPDLSYLLLARNQLLTVQSRQLREYVQRRSTLIDLRDNPFDCGCQNTLLFQLAHDEAAKEHIVGIDTYKCKSPTEYQNEFITSLALTKHIDWQCKVIYIYIGVATGSTFIVSIIGSAIIYKKRWYIRWCCYRMRRDRQTVTRNPTSCSGVQQPQYPYDVYLSYLPDDIYNFDWFDRFAKKLEELLRRRPAATESELAMVHPLKNVTTVSNEYSEEEQPLLTSAAGILSSYGSSAVSEDTEHINSRHRVYYESRDADFAGQELKQIGDAIMTSEYAVIFLSVTYLKDSRRQCELDEIIAVMRQRHGIEAYTYVIVIALQRDEQPDKKLVKLLPRQLQIHFANTRLICVASDDVTQQECPFWEVLRRRLRSD
jgi:Leucine-rich repeat (LRR) protein